MSIANKNAEDRYRVIEWIDYLHQAGNPVMLQVGSPEVEGLKTDLIWFWLDDLNRKGLIEMLDWPKLPVVPGMLGSTKDDWFVFNVKEGFHDHVDTVYRWLRLSIEGLSDETFIALVELSYELMMQLEITKGNTVSVGRIAAKTRFPQIEDNEAELRVRALKFLKEYGAIDDFSETNEGYSVKLTRRYFDRTFQNIMTHARNKGLARYKGEEVDAHTKEPPQPLPQGPIDAQTLKVDSSNYDPTNATLNLQGVSIPIQVRKKGRGSKASETKKARLMRLLFNVKGFPKSVEFHQVKPVSRAQMTPQIRKQVINYVTDIRADLEAHGAPTDLIGYDQTRVFISSRYLKPS